MAITMELHTRRLFMSTLVILFMGDIIISCSTFLVQLVKIMIQRIFKETIILLRQTQSIQIVALIKVVK